jgi:RNA 3'-terminal phosphate cyclase (ATP)
MQAAAKAKLVSAGFNPDIIDIAALREKGENVVGYGSGIMLWAETTGGCVLGGSAVGKRGLDPADVGEAAANELLRNLDHGGCVDEYLQVRFRLFVEGWKVSMALPRRIRSSYS